MEGGGCGPFCVWSFFCGHDSESYDPRGWTLVNIGGVVRFVCGRFSVVMTQKATTQEVGHW